MTTTYSTATVPCARCGNDATHLLVTTDGTSSPLCGTHATEARNQPSTDRLWTRTALLRRHRQLEDRYDTAWRRITGHNGSFTQQRYYAALYADASHKYDQIVTRCRQMGLTVSGF